MVKPTLNLRTKYNLAIISLIGTLAVIIFCIYNLKELVTGLKAIRINIAETKRDIILLDKVINDKNQYSSDIDKIKNTLPSKYYEIAFFTSQLETLGQNNNLVIQTSIDQKATEEKDGYSTVNYSLVLKGSYSSVSEFLSQLQKLPYHTFVDDLKMTNENEGLISVIKLRLFIKQ